MNVNKIKSSGQQKPNEALNKSLEKILEDWLNDELPKMIDEEIEKLQTTENLEVALDTDSLEETKKNIADVIKGCFQ